jgi:hypothetical protein
VVDGVGLVAAEGWVTEYVVEDRKSGGCHRAES